MDSSVKFCGECGAALVQGTGFCGECGTAASSSQNNSEGTTNASPDSEKKQAHSEHQTKSYPSTKYEKWWPKSTAGKITRLAIAFTLLLCLIFFGGASFIIPCLIIFGWAIWTITKSAIKEYKENKEI